MHIGENVKEGNDEETLIGTTLNTKFSFKTRDNAEVRVQTRDSKYDRRTYYSGKSRTFCNKK